MVSNSGHSILPPASPPSDPLVRPPTRYFGSSYPFGGGASPIDEARVRDRVSCLVNSPFPGRNGDMRIYADGVIQTNAGWYRVLARTDENGEENRALVFSTNAENLALRCELPKPGGKPPLSARDQYVVYAGHKNEQGWRWLLNRVQDHTDAVVGAMAGNMLYRTAIGVYQSSAVSYRMVPDAKDDTQVQLLLYSNNYHDHEFEPVENRKGNVLRRLANAPHVMGTFGYEEAEHFIAEDFARRQTRIAEGRDPLSMAERIRHPRQFANRLLQAGGQELDQHNWRNPREWVSYGGQALVVAGKALLSGGGFALDWAIDFIGEKLKYVRAENGAAYHLPLNLATKRLSVQPPRSSLLNRALMPLKVNEVGDYRFLDACDLDLGQGRQVPPILPVSSRRAEIDYLVNPFAVPGSLVKFWRGETGAASTSIQQADGIRLDFMHAANGAVSDLYARYLPAWRVADTKSYCPHDIPQRVTRLFEPERVLHLCPAGDDITLQQVDRDTYKGIMANARTRLKVPDDHPPPSAPPPASRWRRLNPLPRSPVPATSPASSPAAPR